MKIRNSFVSNSSSSSFLIAIPDDFVMTLKMLTSEIADDAYEALDDSLFDSHGDVIDELAVNDAIVCSVNKILTKIKSGETIYQDFKDGKFFDSIVGLAKNENMIVVRSESGGGSGEGSIGLFKDLRRK